MQNKLYTYNIIGGSPFILELNTNPNIEHDGGESTGHLYINSAELEEISHHVLALGSSVQFWESVQQTKQQQIERQKLLGFQKQDAVFPTGKCPECAWFDPLSKHYCGLSDWPQEAIEILMTKPHHIQHSKECPSPDYWSKDNTKDILK